MSAISPETTQFCVKKNSLSLQSVPHDETTLLKEYGHYQTLFESSRDAICIIDSHKGYILRVNRATETLFNRLRHELVGLHHTDLYPPAEYDEYTEKFTQQVNGEITYITGEIYTGNGRIVPVEISSSLVEMPNGTWALQYLFRDITERQEAEISIHLLACYDPLTRLPNRWRFIEHLNRAKAIAHRNNSFCALLLLDLNDFKRINTACGHNVGDQVLQEVAIRLNSILRQEDITARFGGDEFAILLPNLAHSERMAAWFAETVIDKIHHVLSRPYSLPIVGYSPSASIGVTLFSGLEEPTIDLIKQAETAMYRAKELRCDTACFFDIPMQEAVKTRFILENDLRQAIEKNQLYLFLQPQVNRDGQIVGAEALLRWEHPQRGLVSPADFIPLAEETGLILLIGEWVLIEVCHAAVRLADGGLPLPLAANISPRQFRHPNFVMSVQAICAATGADPNQLTLEITEGVVIENLEDTIAKMLELKALGFRFSIDDFGTGYSSLNYLRRLPADELKIDKSFVHEVTDNSSSALVEAIFCVAQHMNMTVVAEGVETAEQDLFLKDCGCQFFQGYLYGRPERSETLIESWLANPPGSPAFSSGLRGCCLLESTLR